MLIFRMYSVLFRITGTHTFSLVFTDDKFIFYFFISSPEDIFSTDFQKELKAESRREKEREGRGERNNNMRRTQPLVASHTHLNWG